MKVKVERLFDDVKLPFYAKEGDAGFDLRSYEDLILKAGEKRIIKTGLKIAIPEGYVGLIWDRSGLAAKHTVHTLAGVIDSGFRGELGIVIKNSGSEDFPIEKHMRIAQMLIQPVHTADFHEEKLNETERGSAGFGSTGF